MKWATVIPREVKTPHTGVLGEDGSLYLLDPSITLHSLLGDDGEILAHKGAHALADPVLVAPVDEVTFLPPLPEPSTIRDFYAFEQHVATARARRGLEMEPLWYKLPVFYFTNPYAAIGHGAFVTPPHTSQELDYELEVAAIVGMGGESIHERDARRHIVGYTLMNDWSARDIQRDEMKLSMGPVKGKDFATSLGPWMVTPDELEDRRSAKSFDLPLTATVNGRVYSKGNLADIHWSFEEMIAYASRDTSCRPGDVIGSGTCGTGCILELSLVHGSEAYPYLQHGDVVTLAAPVLGELSATVQPRL